MFGLIVAPQSCPAAAWKLCGSGGYSLPGGTCSLDSDIDFLHLKTVLLSHPVPLLHCPDEKETILPLVLPPPPSLAPHVSDAPAALMPIDFSEFSLVMCTATEPPESISLLKWVILTLVEGQRRMLHISFVKRNPAGSLGNPSPG